MMKDLSRVLLTGVVLFSTGACTHTLYTSTKAARKEVNVGVPYHLPKGIIRFSLTTNKNEKTNKIELVTLVEAVVVPDKSAMYILSENHNQCHSDSFGVRVNNNGLLSTVEGASEDKTKDAVSSILGAAVNVLSFSSVGGFASVSMNKSGIVEEIDKTVDPSPTNEEVQEILNRIYGGKHSYILDVSLGDREFFVPGTGNNVAVSILVEPLHGEPNVEGAHNKKLTPASCDGILVRPQRSVNVKSMISVKGPYVKVIRREIWVRKMNAAKESVLVLKSEKERLDGLISGSTDKAKSKYNDDLSKVIRELGVAVRNAERVEVNYRRYVEQFDDPVYSNGYEGKITMISISNNPMIVPDLGVTIRIPVVGANFVKTTNSLVLNNGMLAKWDVSRPSEVLGLAGYPLDITKMLVNVPAQILQFKFDIQNKKAQIASKEAEQAEAEMKLLDIQRSSNVSSEVADNELTAKLLQTKLEVLKLKREIMAIEEEIEKQKE